MPDWLPGSTSPPDQRLDAPTFSAEGVLTLHWYGTEVDILIDGESIPFTEWLQKREGQTVRICFEESEGAKP